MRSAAAEKANKQSIGEAIMSDVLGPIIGHTTDTTAKIWMRGEKEGTDAEPVCVGAIEVRDAGGHVQSRYCRLLSHHDFTGCVTMNGLSAATEYNVRIGIECMAAGSEPPIDHGIPDPIISGDPLETSTFRTAPAPDSVALRFVFGSCRYNFWWGNASKGDKTFRSILARHGNNRLDLMIMLGDQIYADPLNVVGQANELEEFWEIYRDYFGQPHIRLLMGQMPTYMMMDDHEIRNDWSKEQMKKYGGLFNAAIQAYESYQHLHNPDTLRGNFWYDFRVGAFPFFAVDTRTARIKSSTGNARKTLLGLNQYNALIDWLFQNKSAPKLFVISSVPFIPDNRSGEDKWSEFDEERGRILEFIRNEGIGGVTFLSGDVHNTNFSRMKCLQDPAFEVVSLVSSPFYWPYPHEDESAFFTHRMLEYFQWKTADRREMDFVQYQYQAEGFIAEESFVEVEIDLNASPPISRARVFGRKGKDIESYPNPFEF